MLHRLRLKVTKFQLPPPKRLSTVVKRFGGGGIMASSCQIRLMHNQGKAKIYENWEVVLHYLIIYGERLLNNWLKTSFDCHCFVQ